MEKKAGFVTCVRLGLSCIEEIYRLGGSLEVIFTLEDSMARGKSGRVYLDEFAENHGIPLIKIRHINEEAVRQEIRKRELDWLFIIGWSQIAGRHILDAPGLGCIGMHPTLLPKGRGRASVPWAILKGLPETGVTMFRLDEGVDTGDVIAHETIPMHENITATELYEKVNRAHIELIRKNWGRITDGTVIFKRQDESQATQWPGRRPEDGRITENMRVEEALRLIRAVTHPYPGAFYDDRDRRWRIWSACEAGQGLRLKDGWIRPLEYEIEEHEIEECDGAEKDRKEVGTG